MTTTKIEPAALAATLAAAAPLGWTATTGEGYIDDGGDVWEPKTNNDVEPGRRWVKFERTLNGVAVVIAMNVGPASDFGDGNEFSGLTVEGHTIVNGGTFTRRGVDCSSCQLVDDPKKRFDHDYGSIESLLVGEWERCEASVARSKTAEKIDGTPFSRQPEWFSKASADLKAGRSVSVTPSGFGTGYRFSKRRESRYDTRADPKLEARLGGAPLYVSKLDCD